MKISVVLTFVLMLMTVSDESFASTKPDLPLLPSDFIYLECVEIGCTDSEIRSKAINYVYAHGNGHYTFLLANIETEHLIQMDVSLRDTCGREPGCNYPPSLFTSDAPVPAQYATEFKDYSRFLKSGPSLTYEIPAHITPTFSRDQGVLSAMQNHLNLNYPALRNSFLQIVVITLEFSDGSVGLFTWYQRSTYKLDYKCCAKDADGNPIAGNASTDPNRLVAIASVDLSSANYVNYDLEYQLWNSTAPSVDEASGSSSGGSKMVCYVDASGSLLGCYVMHE